MGGAGKVTWGLAVAAVVLVALGVVLTLTARGAGTSFGWFAYAPLTEGPLVLWTTRELLGAVLVAAGLVVAAGAAGFALGRRSSRRAG